MFKSVLSLLWINGEVYFNNLLKENENVIFLVNFAILETANEACSGHGRLKTPDVD